MIDRRSFIASAAPLLASTIPAPGTKHRAASVSLRAALDAYLDAYRVFFGVPLSDLPDDNDGSPQSVAIWRGWLDRCRKWRSTREALAELVLEHAGLKIGDNPSTVLAPMADLGDVLVLVTADPDYEGVTGRDCTQVKNVFLAPKSPAMQSRIAALPSWDGEDVCDNTYHTEFHYEYYLENPRTPEDKAKARAARAARESRPTRDEVIAAINEAHAADAAAEGDLPDDGTVAAIVERQEACWERVKDLARRYADLPEDFTDTAVTVGDHIVTIAENRGYEMPNSVQSAGVDVWALKRVY